MTSANSLLLDVALAAAGALLLARIAERIGVPDVVVFLLAGISVGSVGWHPVEATSGPGHVVIVVAVAYILYKGGEALEAQVIARVWPTVLMLATVGVIITMLITGVAAALAFGLPLLVGLLAGAVVASTDPAVLIPIYRTLNVRPRVAQVVISESALNDATGAICTTVVLGLVVGGGVTIDGIALRFAQLLGVGAAVGAISGAAAAFLLDERVGVLRPFAGALTLVVAVVTYAVAGALGGSALLAAFVAGFVFGNVGPLRARISEQTRAQERDYSAPTSVLLRGLLFIGLGDSLDIRGIVEVAPAAIAVTAVLMLIARPVVVLICAAPDRISRWRLPELALFAWSRETGVVPGALASLLLAEGAPSATIISKLTAVAIIVTVVVQGTTTAWLAQRLGLVEPSLRLSGSHD
jgi:cell volume regulation protein A